MLLITVTHIVLYQFALVFDLSMVLSCVILQIWNTFSGMLTDEYELVQALSESFSTRIEFQLQLSVAYQQN